MTLDNEKKIDETMPEESAEPLTEESEVPEELHGGVVIENFDDEKDEDDELYERYVELMNQEEEEDADDIASVAERITGERHSKVTTAAPLRIRDTSSQTAPQAAIMPVRKPQPPKPEQAPEEVQTPVAPVHTPGKSRILYPEKRQSGSR